MRPIKIVSYSSHFERTFQRLPLEVKIMATKREAIFRRDCFDPRLKTHKLSGGLAGQWSFSIQYRYRVLFRFLNADHAYFMDAGDHSIYQ